ncbi:hypothetical protein AU15_12535 [Marinobacter salarius]|uniref:PAS domain-containing protein n=1 Tax=Marinobacter salarius TaxID=1420917 RepID=W5YWG9_9GAMM|nr:hypothetical protein AU15_12535 [Marinobacter salarius]
MRRKGQQPNLQRQLIALVAGLCLTIILTVCFMVAVVQVQSAITAYTWGESVWSRAQIDTVHHLNRFSESGDFSHLAKARQALAVPIGDLHARVAITSDTLDWQRAKHGFLQGGNHEEDLTRMILLIRLFSWLDQLERALTAWEGADDLLFELDQIGNAMEREWLAAPPDREQLQALRDKLAIVDQQLQVNAREFRLSMGDASRWAASFLSVVSALFLTLVALLSWFLGFRLVRLLNRTEQNFRSIFEQSAIGIIQIDTEGRIVNANQATCDILGYRPDDLVHRPIGSWSIRKTGTLPGKNDGISASVTSTAIRPSIALFEKTMTSCGPGSPYPACGMCPALQRTSQRLWKTFPSLTVCRRN